MSAMTFNELEVGMVIGPNGGGNGGNKGLGGNGTGGDGDG